jgi:hypothetical protein
LLRIRRSEDLFSLALCVAVVIVGVMLIAQALEQYRRAQTMAAWPTTLGRVLSSGIEPVAADGELRWRPAVRYLYEVNGQGIISTGLSVAAARDNYSEAQARHMIAPYPANTTVLVFYNPEHVSEAVLDLSLPRFVWLSLILGLALVSAGGARLLMAHRVFWR